MIPAAAPVLGRSHAVRAGLVGVVVPGRRLGRRLGVPTANVVLPATTSVAFGSYAGLVDTGGRRYRALVHLGTRPSVGGRLPLLEAHLLGFAGTLYGHRLAVTLLDQVSEEEHLRSPAALAAKVRSDLRCVYDLFARC